MFEYTLTTRIEKLGAHELKLECLENLDRTIDRLFEFLQKEGRESLLETLCPYFGVVWPSARALTEQLAELGAGAFEGKRVLELGCGLAIPSLLLSKLGAQVTATDFHPEVPRFLERNIALNGIPAGELRYLHLDWQGGALPQERFDWVIGSDILYEKQQPAILARAIRDHLAPGGRAIVADPARPYLQAFVDEMQRRGFRQHTAIRSARDVPVDKEIFLVSFERAV
ncbi:MAG: protein N-lysine methyltransferase family protein [Oligoflexia bacterium]|nr:protein N-lysine methyltransferase family protein [Oligoflexia bacterium]